MTQNPRPRFNEDLDEDLDAHDEHDTAGGVILVIALALSTICVAGLAATLIRFLQG